MRIFVLCPSGSKTGGAECLHQFVHALRAGGADAYVSYVPDPGGAGTHEFFRAYDAPRMDAVDDPANLVVVPELSTYLVKAYPRSAKAVFWLSIDNYFYRKRESLIADWYRRLRSLQTTRVRLGAMKGMRHLSQSRYATDYLAGKGLRTTFIGDYLNDEFFETADEIIRRRPAKRDQVAYNPAKGARYIREISLRNPHIRFVPIVNMKRAQVVELLSESKAYIDLGHHPGKDRIPREAAVLGCCVITNRSGSAGNDHDVPIPADYKFDLGRSALAAIPAKIEQAFSGFDRESARFEPYRAAIRAEKERFFADTRAFVQTLKIGTEIPTP